jgi:hypothetical protein
LTVAVILRELERCHEPSMLETFLVPALVPR